MWGSDNITKDVDVCYARDDENLSALVRALRTLDAHLRSWPKGVSEFIDEIGAAAALEADARGVKLIVSPVPEELAIEADKQILSAVVGNLVQNAFKFSHARAATVLTAFAVDAKVHIEVHDQCGGLPAGSAEKIFTPFTQRSEDRSGLGLGLAIARNSVEADFGTLTVRDVPGVGCVFTIALPMQSLLPLG